MLARILAALSNKSTAASLSEIAEVLNREVIPVLRAVRAAINAASADVNAPAYAHQLVPTAGTTASFTAIDSIGSAYPAMAFDPGSYPETVSGRAREVHFEVVGAQGAPGAASSVEFQLYDATNAASIATVLTTSSVYATKGAVGPFAVGSGTGEIPDALTVYQVRGRRVGGTTEEAVLYSSGFIVRYV